MGLVRFLIQAIIISLAVVEPALAQHGDTSSLLLSTEGLAGISIAIAAFGGALGQGKVISAALESIGRNPGAANSMTQPWFLALAFIESLVLFTLLVATKLAGIW